MILMFIRSIRAMGMAAALFAPIANAASEPARAHRGFVGLPLVSTDGQEVGHVTHVAVDEAGLLLVAEVSRPLGIGSTAITLPGEMFINQGYKVEVTLTAEKLRARAR
jgi:hypothetical protein